MKKTRMCLPPFPCRLTLAAAAFALAALVAVSAPADEWSLNGNGSPILTNQRYLEETRNGDGVEIDDLKAVFSYVFAGLEDQVHVYPTENYFYYKFYHAGVRYAGNIRLDVLDRDQGKLHFAYFRDYTEWSNAEDVRYKLLGPEDGIVIEKLAALEYKVSYNGKSVTFQLNDLSNVRPADAMVRTNEDYIGPVHDESGLRFFLVYNRKYKAFQYFLDETAPVAETLEKSRVTDDMLIGVRSGFAFHIDKYLKRKILIGVFEGNSNVNNYFDGPFDQLPDNYLGDGRLRRAILDIEPGLDGEIDIYGNSPGGEERYFVGSYMYYRDQEDLAFISACAADASLSQDEYYGCFSVDETDEDAHPEDPPASGQ